MKYHQILRFKFHRRWQYGVSAFNVLYVGVLFTRSMVSETLREVTLHARVGRLTFDVKWSVR